MASAKAKDPLLRIPPYSEEAEVAVVGMILIAPTCLDSLAELLTAEDFYHERYREIYKACLYLYSQGKPIDLVTLVDGLRNRKTLDIVGGSTAVAELLEQTASAAHVGEYANIVRQKATQRALISVCSKISEKSYSSQSAEELLNWAESQVLSIGNRHLRTYFASFDAIMEELKIYIDRLHNGELGRGLATGFIDLDRILGGLKENDLIVIAARPAQGKSALLLNIAGHVATGGHPVGIFSLEMSKEQLGTRHLCSVAKVDSHKFTSGRCSQEETERLLEKQYELRDLPIYIDDTTGLSILDMTSKARRLKREKHIALLGMDYLQLAKSVRYDDDEVRGLGEIAVGLKEIAKELSIPVIAVAQLNRLPEMRSDKRPIMSDIRSSGEIEQAADVIMFLYRDEIYDPQTKDKGVAEVIIGKHRNGPTGIVRLGFRAEMTEFYNLAQISG